MCNGRNHGYRLRSTKAGDACTAAAQDLVAGANILTRLSTTDTRPVERHMHARDRTLIDGDDPYTVETKPD